MELHVCIVLIIFALSIILMGLKMNLEKPIKITLDNFKNNKKPNITWQKYWKNNYSKFDDNLENIFKEPEKKTYLKPLTFDGI